jgi:hypothetical protein
MRTSLVVFIWFVSCGSGFAANQDVFAGVVTARLTRGTASSQFVFTRKGNQLRIENTTNQLEPINIVDLAANKLTIVYPHNTTFVQLDLTKKAAPSAAPPMPALTPNQAGAPAQLGPAISPPPGFPSPPPMPSLSHSQVPNKPAMGQALPAIPAGAGMGMPMMMPPMPIPGGSGAFELKKTDKTKNIQGFNCTLYTIGNRGEEFTTWVTDDAVLFPFRLIEHNLLRRFGSQQIEENWPELLRDKSLFPLEAIFLTQSGGQSRLTFRVDKIDRHKVEDNKLFEPPKNYIEIEAPQL